MNLVGPDAEVVNLGRRSLYNRCVNNIVLRGHTRERNVFQVIQGFRSVTFLAPKDMLTGTRATASGDNAHQRNLRKHR